MNFLDKNLKANSHRIVKNIKRRDYEKKLFQRLTQDRNVAIVETIQNFWDELIQENEKLRFSSESAEAFRHLSNIFGYGKFEKREGSIVDCIVSNGEILTDSD